MDTLIEHLIEAELTFDNPRGMLIYGSKVGFIRLNQI